MSNLQEILRYTPPVYHQGKESYIDFYAYDPVDRKMRRKKIKLNHVNEKQRKKYAKDLLLRLTEKLILGWNPWIEKESGSAYMLFSECTEAYRIYIDKLFRDGTYRYESHKSLASQLKNLIEWNNSKRVPITYIYQFDKDLCVSFLDEIYLNRDNSAYTHDNYLSFLKNFSSWCVSRNYLKSLPTEGILPFGAHWKKKKRTTISANDMEALHDYLQHTNKHFMLGAYLLYYCFIRPAEMCRLKISDISVKKQTIFIPDYVSKNKRDGTITLPAKVIKLMLDLGTFNHPSSHYIFSKDFMPGSEKVSEKIFRDWWARHVRKDLKFPDTYKFYSLKDTGITNMLRHSDVLSVRDQARHSSILMTDIYTPHDIQEANALIMNYDDAF